MFLGVVRSRCFFHLFLQESRVLVESGGKNEFHERDWYRGRSTRDYTRGKQGFTKTMRRRTPVPLIEVALLWQRDAKTSHKHWNSMFFHRFFTKWQQKMAFSTFKFECQTYWKNIKSNQIKLIFSNLPQSKFVKKKSLFSSWQLFKIRAGESGSSGREPFLPP